jgi:hypothetical protein
MRDKMGRLSVHKNLNTPLLVIGEGIYCPTNKQVTHLSTIFAGNDFIIVRLGMQIHKNNNIYYINDK